MTLLCEPYLLDPQPDGIHVLWHTEQVGRCQVVLVGVDVPRLTEQQAYAAATGPAESGDGWRRFAAETRPLSRMREDAESSVPGRTYAGVTPRRVYRHLARVGGLPAGRTPYRVVSVDDGGHATVTATYSLAPAVSPGRPVRLLLTSDHQLMPMVPANLATVGETAGTALDGVLMAGDMVNVPDRASDWFDSTRRPAFFASFAGRAAGRWPGASILPNTPLYPAIGNHEVMGRWSATGSLEEQFNDPQPGDWDVTTYAELFPVPRSDAGGPRWWSRTIGDVHLISLFATAVWRSPKLTGRGKFQEAAEDVDHPRRWGNGQFIFEPVARGSAQYRWLVNELASPAARAARYRVVMFHHPSHGLGHHSAPPFTDPVPTVRPGGISYHYPLADDHILRDVEPLLDEARVHLVLNGHSHLWNRFRNAAGVHWLETSNVGNSYGAYDVTSGRSRGLPDGYVQHGDPGGLAPIVPTVAPLAGPDGTALPYVASNEITVFTLLDTADGLVRSYRFDTVEPNATAVLFDEFPLDGA
ncbi:metallophosphoesterase family protein [Micromonospora narathiwatensis]|uniref:Calcineurin-like phosphoesterase n=1 Tax=Micromonospora narathiwatensis TaxID=299146 RepID=A0A1A8ZIW0_9ACTN|nr:metallophosphoesterase [Micromonospora narathiwatensis]SBT43817.1 Calcineurin-like phosphoesterase [Micromonospora narathiwatensis]